MNNPQTSPDSQKTSTSKFGYPPPKNQRGGPIFLGAVAIVLSLSILMSALASFPLALAQILYGRLKGFILIVVVAVIVWLLSQKMQGPFIFWSYIVSALFSVPLAHIVLAQMNPLKGFLLFGVVALMFFGGAIGFKVATMNVPFEEYVLKNATFLSQELQKEENQIFDLKGEEAQEILQTISDPKKLSQELLNFLPKVFFGSVFFILWCNLFLLLRARGLYSFKLRYPYSEKHLFRLKVPDFFVWPVIACLVVLVMGEGAVNIWVYKLAQNILYGIGPFYFFQGFGIFWDVLNHFGIKGFVRSLLMVFTIVSGHWMLLLVGFFDMWVDFRKFIMKKNLQEPEEDE
jgi:hypothetical protein